MFKTPLLKKYYDRDMLKECSVCHQSFEPEPGYYFGAMYVSYGFSVALTVGVIVFLYKLMGDPSMWVYVTVLLGLNVLLLPVMYRYSRAIFLHVFGGIGFDTKYAKE
ncbi:DUF983 domain-containing protein [Reichenbachiella ulvae]|uniref:DUF983 domain-containing protein n=1 Tax=Reichenbachiella ulvae TaxID=2980104 RepID=A0ABT3CVD9_9BACT|nr:DUF983 domain-containing protein [Reichenbachiella ulvae]MCV9387655.1 DUF983 domain-containing protein [Reichenbachiella ulvae]